MDTENLETNSVSSNAVEDLNGNYAEALKALKQNSVNKSDYDRVVAENKELLNSIINGQSQPVEVQPVKEEVDVNKLRKELYSKDSDLSNLEYWEKTLQLREAIIDKGGKDPFVPYGSHISATKEDYAAADEVAEVIQKCIDVADGDSSIFTRELQRIMVDTVPYRRK